MKGMVISEFTMTRNILRGILYSIELSDIVLLPSGRQGRDAIQSDDFDIVLVDSCLCDVSLMRLIEALRLHAKHVSIFVFGAETNKDFVLEVFQAGATDFIIRPFKLQAVQKRIKQALLKQTEEIRESL